jgi:multidrug resistance efflux pump
MLLRISLGIAILAGLAAFYFIQVPVKGKIDELTTNLQTAETERATAQDNERKAKAAETKAKSELTLAQKELMRKLELDITKGKLNEQQLAPTNSPLISRNHC